MSTLLNGGEQKESCLEGKTGGGGMVLSGAYQVMLEPKLKVEGITSELDTRGSECDENTGSNEEMHRLKDLLLIHLDYLQQQSELLTKKDKLVDELRTENDVLKQRIERMERRVSLNKKPNNADCEGVGVRKRRNADVTLCSSANSLGRRSMPEPCTKRLRDTRTNIKSGETPDISTVLRSHDETLQQQQKTGVGSSAPGVGSKLGRARKLRTSSCSAASEGGGPESSTTVVASKKQQRGGGGGGGRGIELRNEEDSRSDTSREGGGGGVTLEGKLTTVEPYFTAIGESETKWSKEGKELPPPQLEVPLWRKNVLTPTYTMEGTENLSDEVFEGRHHKLMIDEKKRKRWDVQRIREQRQNERLRSRETAGPSLSHPCSAANTTCPGIGPEANVKSILPTPAHKLCLAVTEKLPISIFGVPVPDKPIREFCVPWRDTRRAIPISHFNKKRTKKRR